MKAKIPERLKEFFVTVEEAKGQWKNSNISWNPENWRESTIVKLKDIIGQGRFQEISICVDLGPVELVSSLLFFIFLLRCLVTSFFRYLVTSFARHFVTLLSHYLVTTSLRQFIVNFSFSFRSTYVSYLDIQFKMNNHESTNRQ